jgi:peptide/nickel transport system substrate-binding protein
MDPDPGVEHRVKHVRHDVGGHHEERGQQDDADDHGKVLRGDGLHGQRTETWQAEDVLGDHHTAEDDPQVDAGLGDDRGQRAAQRVNEKHPGPGQALGPRGAQIVLAENLQQAGTGDIGPPPQDLPSLESTHDSRLVISGGPVNFTYVSLNQYAGPFRNSKLRQAVAYALNKNTIAQIIGGPQIARPATQFMLPGSIGYVPGFNPYPDNNGNGNPAMAKQMIKAAGYSHGPTIKLIFSTSDPTPREAQAMQSSLQAAGFTVKMQPVTQSDWYAKYLEQPSTAKGDVWDISLPGWIPDWFGNNGRATIQPLFTKPGPLANDFDGYNSPVTNALVSKALTAASPSAAASYWAKANEQVTRDVADVPLIYQRWAVFHSSRVHGCVFFVNAFNCDPANVWLSG